MVKLKSVDEAAIRLEDGRAIPANYREFTHGYAITAHRSQVHFQLGRHPPIGTVHDLSNRVVAERVMDGLRVGDGRQSCRGETG